MINLGYANGWKETPEIVRQCEHKTVTRVVGNCLEETSCEVCGYVYKVDSSD